MAGADGCDGCGGQEEFQGEVQERDGSTGRALMELRKNRSMALLL